MEGRVGFVASDGSMMGLVKMGECQWKENRKTFARRGALAVVRHHRDDATAYVRPSAGRCLRRRPPLRTRRQRRVPYSFSIQACLERMREQNPALAVDGSGAGPIGDDEDALLRLFLHQYPLQRPERYSAGSVRAVADDNLQAAVCRVAALAAIVAERRGGVLGLMITASHNPPEENGVKIVRSDGGLMMDDAASTPRHLQQEHFGDALSELLSLTSPADGAPAESMISLRQRLLALVQRVRVGEPVSCRSSAASTPSGGGLVVIGYDNRASSTALEAVAVQATLTASGGCGVRQVGLTTTPYLQYCVRSLHDGNDGSWESYCDEHLLLGYRAWCRALQDVAEDAASSDTPASAYDTRTVLLVDGAYGAASVVLERLAAPLDFPLQLRHTHRQSQQCNRACGAEYVHRQRQATVYLQCDDQHTTRPWRAAAFDGDADRVIWYEPAADHECPVTILDGDWMAMVLSALVSEQLQALQTCPQLTVSNGVVVREPFHRLRFGTVLTAYANGAYWQRLRQRSPELHWVPTGVQYLRDRAEVALDIAVYCEPNGHAAVYASAALRQRLREAMEAVDVAAVVRRAARRLLALTALLGKVGSDAVALLLVVEALWRCETPERFWQRHREWLQVRRYPSVSLQLKLSSEVRWHLSADETRVLQPEGYQTEVVDAARERVAAQVGMAVEASRAVVRPSQTERVLRIYAECAESEAAARALAEAIAVGTRAFLERAPQKDATSTEDISSSCATALTATPLAQFEADTVPPVYGTLSSPTKARNIAVDTADAAVVGIVLAAGQGTRFRAAYPKVVHSFRGRPLVRYSVQALQALSIPSVVVVGAATHDWVQQALAQTSATLVWQRQPWGTGHAVYTAYRACLPGCFAGDVVVLYGDNPGMNAIGVQRALQAHREHRRRYAGRDTVTVRKCNGEVVQLPAYVGLVVSGCYEQRDAGSYGRIVRRRDDEDAEEEEGGGGGGGDGGPIAAIVEASEIGADNREYAEIREFNSGMVVAHAVAYFTLLGECRARARGAGRRPEYYATDFVHEAVQRGCIVQSYVVREGSAQLWRLEGANTVEELEALEQRAEDDQGVNEAEAAGDG
ncbi:hypothetical protein CDCA_CDCA12G3462 [Cyanidium caldarium]|uniref:Phosphoacetylglucosamine mutase n=1 Tax=Cyanidium caldarium TaxID=2771 RepID=A0AAV9IYN6_CYACA|nr:hypothetical protein CDCA_CDCA12G3462 [Cyanidium caldarium]